MFDQFIGGLLVDVCSDIQLASIKTSSADLGSQSTADIRIKIRYAQDACFDESQESIFATKNFKVCIAADGFQIFRFRDDQQHIPWVSIHADRHFSVFSFSYQDAAVGSKPGFDLYRTAADAFLLQHTFINHQGLILHAAAGSVQGKGMIFSGPSGAGKSTLSLLLEQSPTNRLFSDERVVARSMEDGWRVWGTPWHGTGNIARNENAPLSAIVFLRQAETSQITKLSSSAGLRRLLQVVSIPWYSKEWTNKGLAVCESLIQAVPMFELAFRPDQTATEAVERLAASLP